MREEKMMHARVLSLIVVSTALSCASEGALAQSAYSYPWCGSNGGGENCYYSTLEQCIATTAGARGGRCFASPYYRHNAAVATRSQERVAARATDRAVVTDRAAVRAPRAASVPSVPASRSARSNSTAPLATDQLLAQDYSAVVASAEQGDATAQYNLARMYDTGRGGVLQDYVMAHKWYNLAASHYATWEIDIGTTAARSRDRLTLKMTPAQIAEAQKMARDWEPKARR